MTRNQFCKGIAASAAVAVTSIPDVAASPHGIAKKRTVELFAGIGGFRIAADKLGLETVWANDINENAVNVYRDRFGYGSIVHGDINSLLGAIPPHDILTGGFPCQPFSRAGKKMGIDDIRGTLFEAIVKVLNARNPDFFFLENVNSLLFLNNGRHFRTILSALCDIGYKIEWRVFNAASFGLPQQRLRVIIAGCKTARRDASFFLEPSDLKKLTGRQLDSIADGWTDVLRSSGRFPQWGMAVGGLFTTFDFEPLRSIETERKLEDVLESDVAPMFDFTENTKERIAKSEFVDKFYNGVHILYNQGHGARMGYTIFGTDGLSPTLTASASRHYERYEIGGRYRRLTNVEYARLQGFPDDHCSAVSVYEQYRLFGNAVPPPLAEYAMRKVLENRSVAVESRQQTFWPQMEKS